MPTRTRLALTILAGVLAVPTVALANDVPVFMPDPVRPTPKTIAVDPCPGPLCGRDLPGPVQPSAQGLRVVYLNFDGVTLTPSQNSDDARNNTSAIAVQQMTIPPFNHFDLTSTQGLSRSQIINIVVQEMYQIHAPYNVEFVTTRPTSGNYSMIVFGGTCGSVAGQGGCAGIALLDCGDFLPNNIAFVFPGTPLRIADLATTAAQEGAHTFGLTHTLDNNDVMYPTIQNSIPDGFGAGQVPSNDQVCNGQSFQDSDQLMMDTIGFRGQDTIPPAVNITSPASGAAVQPGVTQVVASVTDNETVVKVEFVVNGTVIENKTSPPYSFVVPANTTPGPNTILSIRSEDDSGNTGSDRVIVYALSGDEMPCDNGQCPDGFECSMEVCVPDNGIDGELGDFCVTSDDCVEGGCAMVGEESRCSTPCTVDEECPSGFECLGDVACWPVDPDEGGCNASSKSGSSAALLVFALGLLLIRRRR